MKKTLYLIITILFLMTFTSCSKSKNVEVSYDKQEIVVELGSEANLKPTVVAGKKVKDINITYTLLSNIGSIDENGLFKALEVGETTLKAVVNNNEKFSATIKIKVIQTSFKITLDLNGGAIDGDTEIEFEDGSEVVLPSPVLPGVNFIGWYEGDTKVETIENRNYNLVAKWESFYTIIYDLNGGITDKTLVTSFKEGEKVELVEPTKEGYEFKGWYEGDKKITKISNQNYILSARWEVISYNVEYELNGGTNAANNPEEYSANILPFALGKPTKEGYAFTGWLLNGYTVAIIPEKTTGDIVLTATWEKEYTISYTLDGGILPDDAVTKFHTLVKLELPIPTKEGYRFKGWYENGVEVTSLDLKDYDLTATWVKVWQITYNKDKGNWPTRTANSQEEIRDTLLLDLYEWAKMNGYTSSFDDYNVYIMELISLNQDINLRNPLLGDQPDGSGDTSYFLNVPEYYDKWIEFFRAFNTMMKAKDSKVDFFTDDYSAFVNFGKFMTLNTIAQTQFKPYMTTLCNKVKIEKELITEYEEGTTTILPKLWLVTGLKFLGWYDNPEFNGSAIDRIYNKDTGDKVYYAKWAEEVFAESISLNEINNLAIYTTYQLKWEFNPTDVTYKKVEFYSSDPNVATIDMTKGLITAKNEGTTTITMRVLTNRSLDKVFTLTVFTPDHIQASFETNSYVKINEAIRINASLFGPTIGNIMWKSSDETVAVVDESGNVTGLREGTVIITAYNSSDKNIYLDILVTVIDNEDDSIINHIVESHESNLFIKKHLGIGAGTPEYYADIYGSVSKILYNSALSIDTTYLAAGNSNGHNNGTMSSIDFITVHYTGNMKRGSNANANANYFANISTNSSIHYTTGNDGVFKCMDDNKAGWHAGAGKAFTWINTEVEYSATDPKYPVFGINENSNFTINGKDTGVKVPEEKEKGRGFVTDSKWLNVMGLAYQVVDGYYQIGDSTWVYSQVSEGRICSKGGNNNSIGIESCVDEGSDLWFTWQKTAQLVSSLMKNHNLAIERVVGHHFFTAKDCPQPLLENDKEIWWEFMDMVEAEYELITTYKDYTVSFESHNLDIIDNNGRFVKLPEYPTCITYTVTVSNKTSSESITLSTLVPGIYQK